MPYKLPIENLDKNKFDEFKKQYLDGKVLDDNTLKELGRLFGVGDLNTGKLNCDEMHRHTYRCNYYSNPITGVVDRLVREVRSYLRRLADQ